MSQESSQSGALVVVPDVNLLIHGKALPDLPWSELGREEIELLYVPPVIREIDGLKVQSGRPNRLARQVSAEVRKLRKSDERSTVVRERSPRVVRRLALDAVTRTFHKSLRLDHSDQALINYCLALEAGGKDVLLLTSDTICATTADDVGLPVLLVDDHWLRDPEPDERDRENARLKDEVRRLASAEPKIEIEFNAEDGSPITALEAEITTWPALSRGEIDELMTRIETGCPVATSFERPEEDSHAKLFQQLAVLQALGSRAVYSPATEAEIEAYKTREYPAWLDSIRDKLGSLHERLERRTIWPRFLAYASNNGSRPAEAVLITVEPRGELQIENWDGEERGPGEGGSSDERPGIALPLPPAPPRGKTKTVNPFGIDLGLRPSAAVQLREALGLPHMPSPRRPDRFYWRHGKEGPNDLFELECECWRHSESKIKFAIAVHPYAAKATAGAVEFTVHAANLAMPRSAKLPVRMTIAEGSTVDKARTLVESLIYCARAEKRL